MNEKISPDMAPTVIKAVTGIREEICGPVVRKVELKMGLAEMLALASDADPALEAEDITPRLEAHEAVALDLDPEQRKNGA